MFLNIENSKVGICRSNRVLAKPGFACVEPYLAGLLDFFKRKEVLLADSQEGQLATYVPNWVPLVSESLGETMVCIIHQGQSRYFSV